MQEHKWKEVSDGEDGEAFSVVQFNTEFGKKANNPNVDFEYFIFLDGMRAENYSKKGTSIGNSGWGTQNYLTELEERAERFKVLSVLLDKDAPLDSQTKLLANKINKLKEMEHCKKITVLGISKCGTMVADLLHHLNDTNLDRLNLLAALPPYLGTIYASPNILYNKVDETIGKVPDNLLKRVIPNLQKIKPTQKQFLSQKQGAKFTKILKDIHWNLFSQSHMDYDISLLGENGVPDEHKDKYDENYLKNLFNEEALSRLRQVKFTNITTTCSNRTLENSLKTLNVTAFMLYLSSRVLFDEPSDGMVTLHSAQEIERVCEEKGIPITTLHIKDGHHDISGDSRIVKEIMQQAVLNKSCKKEEKEDDFLTI